MKNKHLNKIKNLTFNESDSQKCKWFWEILFVEAIIKKERNKRVKEVEEKLKKMGLKLMFGK